MSLYRILSLLCPHPKGNESQCYVDEFIVANSSEKQDYPRPNNSSKYETIYTKLRNEIAHVRNGVDLRDTRTKIDVCVYELAKIVKKAIETKDMSK